MLYGLLIGVWIATIIISHKLNKKAYRKGYIKGTECALKEYVPAPKLNRPSELDMIFDIYTEYDSSNRSIH